MIRRCAFFIATLLFISGSLTTHAAAPVNPKGEALSVSLPEENKTYHYSQTVRLSQVLTDIYPTLHYVPYTLGASLIRVSKTPLIAEEKYRIIQQLITLNTPSSLFLLAQLSNMTFAFREHISLNLPTVRLSPKQDPLLAGAFQLFAPARPDHFLVVGAINQESPLAISLQGGQSLRDYLPTIQMNDQALDSTPWVIQADQTFYQVHDLYWKNKPYFLSPGAVVFIGLKDLPIEFKDLNRDIVHLLTYRVEK